MKEKISKRITPVNLFESQEKFLDEKLWKKGPFIRKLIDEVPEYKEWKEENGKYE